LIYIYDLLLHFKTFNLKIKYINNNMSVIIDKSQIPMNHIVLKNPNQKYYKLSLNSANANRTIVSADHLVYNIEYLGRLVGVQNNMCKIFVNYFQVKKTGQANATGSYAVRLKGLSFPNNIENNKQSNRLFSCVNDTTDYFEFQNSSDMGMISTMPRNELEVLITKSDSEVAHSSALVSEYILDLIIIPLENN